MKGGNVRARCPQVRVPGNLLSSPSGSISHACIWRLALPSAKLNQQHKILPTICPP